MAAFFIQFSLVSVVLSRRAQRTQKSSKEKHIKNLQLFLNARNECKVGKDALTTLWLISGADPENFNNGIQLVHTGEANNLLR